MQSCPHCESRNIFQLQVKPILFECHDCGEICHTPKKEKGPEEVLPYIFDLLFDFKLKSQLAIYYKRVKDDVATIEALAKDHGIKLD